MAIEPLDLRDDAKDQLMQLVRDTVNERRAATAQHQTATTKEALEEHVINVQRILEGAGLDIFAPLTTGVHAGQPDHGWISSPHGIDFEVRPSGKRHGPSADRECWALHPETARPVVKITWQTRFEDIAEAIVRADEATTEPFDADPIVQDDPGLELLNTLRAFLRANLPPAGDDEFLF